MAEKEYVVKIGIDKDAKRLKRIWDDLKAHRECIILGNDPEWHGPMRSFGNINKKKKLEKNGLIDPLWLHLNQHDRSVEHRLIRLKPDVDIEKIEGNDKVFFKLRKRRIR